MVLRKSLFPSDSHGLWPPLGDDRRGVHSRYTGAGDGDGAAREQLETQTPSFTADELIPVQDGQRPQTGNLMAVLSGRDRKKGASSRRPPVLAIARLTASNIRAGKSAIKSRRSHPRRASLSVQHGALASVLSPSSKERLAQEQIPVPEDGTDASASKNAAPPSNSRAVESTVAPRPLPIGVTAGRHTKTCRRRRRGIADNTAAAGLARPARPGPTRSSL